MEKRKDDYLPPGLQALQQAAEDLAADGFDCIMETRVQLGLEEYQQLQRDSQRLDMLDRVWRLATGETARQRADLLLEQGAAVDFEAVVTSYRAATAAEAVTDQDGDDDGSWAAFTPPVEQDQDQLTDEEMRELLRAVPRPYRG